MDELKIWENQFVLLALTPSQCLELLRTNSRVERLYHNIGQQAFKFCLKYQRKTEFRKLCDKLRFIAIVSRDRWNDVIS